MSAPEILQGQMAHQVHELRGPESQGQSRDQFIGVLRILPEEAQFHSYIDPAEYPIMEEIDKGPLFRHGVPAENMDEIGLEYFLKEKYRKTKD